MKFELNRPIDYSDEALLQEIRRVSKLIEKPLTRTKFESNSKYSASTIEKKFGGWIEALRKAGLDSTHWNLANKKISKEEIINELKRVSLILGTTCFSQKDFIRHSNFSDRGIFSRRFGSFNKLMKEAGFTTPLSSRKYTDEERYDNLLNVWSYYGRQPYYQEMNKEPSIVGPKAYVVRWGSWRKALLAFIEKVNEDESSIQSEIENQTCTEPREIKKRGLVSNSRTIPLGLRYDILRRDKFSCTLCGRVPKTHNITLQVDHIIAFNGSNTVAENLRTLCNECNNGKSNKIEN
jgi:5-methylcytosine-specific restriction endonuclease McrA